MGLSWTILDDRCRRWMPLVSGLFVPWWEASSGHRPLEVFNIASVDHLSATHAKPSRGGRVELWVFEPEGFASSLSKISQSRQLDRSSLILVAGDFSKPETLALHRLGMNLRVSDGQDLIVMGPAILRWWTRAVAS